MRSYIKPHSSLFFGFTVGHRRNQGTSVSHAVRRTGITRDHRKAVASDELVPTSLFQVEGTVLTSKATDARLPKGTFLSTCRIQPTIWNFKSYPNGVVTHWRGFDTSPIEDPVLITLRVTHFVRFNPGNSVEQQREIQPTPAFG